MIKINQAEFLSALLCQAKNDVRYYLNGICVDEKGYIVATDGHRMFVGKATTSEETVLLQVKGKPPAKFDSVEIDTQNKSAIFKSFEGNNIGSLPLEIIDGRFPDWRRVANYHEGKVSAIGLNVNYLKDLAKAAKYFNKENAKLTFQDSASSTHIYLTDDAYMIIMPCRI